MSQLWEALGPRAQDLGSSGLSVIGDHNPVVLDIGFAGLGGFRSQEFRMQGCRASVSRALGLGFSWRWWLRGLCLLRV